ANAISLLLKFAIVGVEHKSAAFRRGRDRQILHRGDEALAAAEQQFLLRPELDVSFDAAFAKWVARKQFGRLRQLAVDAKSDLLLPRFDDADGRRHDVVRDVGEVVEEL